MTAKTDDSTSFVERHPIDRAVCGRNRLVQGDMLSGQSQLADTDAATKERPAAVYHLAACRGRVVTAGDVHSLDLGLWARLAAENVIARSRLPNEPDQSSPKQTGKFAFRLLEPNTELLLHHGSSEFRRITQMIHNTVLPVVEWRVASRFYAVIPYTNHMLVFVTASEDELLHKVGRLTRLLITKEESPVAPAGSLETRLIRC